MTATAAVAPPASRSGPGPSPAIPLTTGLIGLFVVVRICQVAAWPVAVLTGGTAGLRSVPAAVTVYAVQTRGGRRAGVGPRTGRGGPGVAGLDATVALVALVAGGLLTRPGHGTGFSHPALPAAIGAGLTVALALSRRQASPGTPRWRSATCSGCTPRSPWVRRRCPGRRGTCWHWWCAGGRRPGGRCPAAGRTARRPGDRTGGEGGGGVGRGGQRIAAHAAYASEVAQQHRMLHDTVLSTLDAVARGAVDTGDPVVRRRLAADADHLRGLIASAGSAVGMRLVGELTTVIRELAPTGLRVHLRVTDVPPDVPPAVVRALTGAVREALNNVIRHSGTSTALVTVAGPAAGTDDPDPARLRVTVADRGRGFDPDRIRPGLGLSRSVRARIGEAGGEVLVDSGAGQGTTVEMSWPPGAWTSAAG
ncbi:ATP-binding protein [Micromonospora sp. BRA006-A]|nr:ATP-binding protein [Micromonospora sp. BRA006-A]